MSPEIIKAETVKTEVPAAAATIGGKETRCLACRGTEFKDQGKAVGEGGLKEIRAVASELVTYVFLIALEGGFLCAWAAAIWGVAFVLDLIEPHMPTWAPDMFKYVEIGFALFVLAKLFIGRSHVFISALRHLHVLRKALSGRV